MPRVKEGSWPQVCVQRAFVEGAKWWEYHETGCTMWPSDRDTAEDEAVKRYGEPEAAPTALPGADIREAFRQGFHFAVTGTRTASAAIAEGIAWGAFQRGERIGPLTHTAQPAASEALREALESLMQRRGVAILEAVRAKDRGLGYQVGMLLGDIARIAGINDPSLPPVPLARLNKTDPPASTD